MNEKVKQLSNILLQSQRLSGIPIFDDFAETVLDFVSERLVSCCGCEKETKSNLFCSKCKLPLCIGCSKDMGDGFYLCTMCSLDVPVCTCCNLKKIDVKQCDWCGKILCRKYFGSMTKYSKSESECVIWLCNECESHSRTRTEKRNAWSACNLFSNSSRPKNPESPPSPPRYSPTSPPFSPIYSLPPPTADQESSPIRGEPTTPEYHPASPGYCPSSPSYGPVEN